MNAWVRYHGIRGNVGFSRDSNIFRRKFTDRAGHEQYLSYVYEDDPVRTTLS